MTTTERITRTVFEAIEELNHQLPTDRRLAKSFSTTLFDSSGFLDSLELVNLIVITEQNVEDEFGVAIVLADERAISQKNSPFKTVETLTNYISILLDTV